MIKKIMVHLKYKQVEENIKSLALECEKNGVKVEILKGNQDTNIGENPAQSIEGNPVKSIGENPAQSIGENQVKSIEKNLAKPVEGDSSRKEPGLWQREGLFGVTDNSQGVLFFQEKGIPFLIYYHEYNKEDSFENVKYGVENIEEIDVSYLERIDQRFRGLPWEIVRTKRCIIRETTIEDAEEFLRMYADKSLTKFTEGIADTIEEEKKYILDYQKCMYEFYEHGIWTILNIENGEVMGRAGIAFREGVEIPEIGFTVAGKYQRRGIATEVVKAIMEYGRKEFNYQEYVAFVHPQNTPSIHLLQKLEFQNTGTMYIQGKQGKVNYLVMNYKKEETATETIV